MKLSKVCTYRQVGYPTRDEFTDDPLRFMKAAPAAWLGKEVVACALAAFVIAGCKKDVIAVDTDKVVAKQQKAKRPGAGQGGKAAELAKEKSNESASVAPLFIHGKGRGALGSDMVAPPVFITEEDARQVIREEMKKAGIEFDSNDVRLDDVLIEQKQPKWEQIEGKAVKNNNAIVLKPLVLDGVNRKLNLGYEFVSANDSLELSGESPVSMFTNYDTKAGAEKVRDKLQAYGKMNAVLFYDPIVNWIEIDAHKKKDNAKPDKRTESEIAAEAKKRSLELLKAQVDDFIEWVKKEGLI